ncbi:unnamed protein product [Vitrella brassicaformis CCMP3155]|uniref:Uncharacterized protein n=2 Tax=Vitrella brassicaformis TaxID=1169539 RepID=A0A0G4GB62_VITBC|nr:unnamed protein product [Vitrella brassicaformis CCMP3155]|eukprot:CEM26370.1 unnamed protein product [Vitrella brassicaformis CCMP3155]
MMRIAVVFALLALTAAVADPYHHDSHYTCPKGWTLKGDGKDAVCYKKTTTHAKEECPKGTKPEGGYHRRRGGVVAGLLGILFGGSSKGKYVELTCYRYEEHPAEKSMHCPKVYEQYDHECKKTSYADLDSYCEKGYDMTKGGCYTYEYNEEEVAHEVYCPKGYTASSKDGKCEKCWTDKKETHCDYKKMMTKCPKGYDERHYGKEYKCVKYTEEKHEGQMYFKCPKGYEQYDDKCITYHTTDPEYEWHCPKGYKLSRGKYSYRGKKGHHEYVCKAKKEVHPDYHCPKGYELHKHECVGYKEMPARKQHKKGYGY